MKKTVCMMVISFMFCAGMLFAGGGSAGKAKSAQGTGTASQREASALAQQAAAGKLPALEQRLPISRDIMVEPMESIGAYGGVISTAFRGKDNQWLAGKMTEEPLFRFTTEGAIEPNVAKSYSMNTAATEFTIYLREGMKWSDGVPFTSEDCIFFYEHMCIPKSFGRSLWNCFYSTNAVTKERTTCTLEKIDDYTFKVKFVDPNPNFLEFLSIEAKWFFAPAHYMKQFLPEFIGDAAAEAKAKELGYNNAAAMGQETGYYYWNIPGRPTLRPWVAVNNIDSDLFIMDRNPYYWKTDAEGRQLPYVDQLQFIRIADENQVVLKAMAGETDIAVGLPYTSIVLLKQNETRGGYNLITWDTTAWAANPLQFNLTFEDAKYRTLFHNKDFRKALSIAADRKEMVDLITDGFAKPTQTSPPEGLMGYSKAWAEKWTEYNPQEAKRLLEQSCGLKMGSNGYYQFADGSPLVIEMLTFDTAAVTAKEAELLIEKYFKNIGIRATFGVRDRSYIDELAKSNKLMTVLTPVAPMNTVNIALRPDTVVPVRNYAVWYGTYGDWYTSSGKTGAVPTGDMLKLINLYRDMTSAVNKNQINQIAMEMLKLHEENIWQIGYLSGLPNLMAVNKNLRNFPAKNIFCEEFRDLGIAHLQQVYFASNKQ